MSRENVPKTPEIWDVAIVGGGVAGSVAAIQLGRVGARAILIEKEREPSRKVCGGVVDADTVRLLTECGINFDRLGAVTIASLRLHGPTRSCHFRLPFAAKGVKRSDLEGELLDLASTSGTELLTNVFVREAYEGPPFKLETDRDDLIAKRLILATGNSEFRSLQSRRGRDESYVAFNMHLVLKPSLRRKLAGAIELFIFRYGYASLSLVDTDGTANFCILIERAALRETGSDWNSIASHIARYNWEASMYLDSAEPLDKHFGTISRFPLGFTRAGRGFRGIFCIGDQMAVMPPFMGEGISVAAWTAREAASAIIESARRGMSPPETALCYERAVRRSLRWRMKIAYGRHQFFKNPEAVDWATYILRSAPWMGEFMFFRHGVQSALHLWPGARGVKGLTG